MGYGWDMENKDTLRYFIAYAPDRGRVLWVRSVEGDEVTFGRRSQRVALDEETARKQMAKFNSGGARNCLLTLA